MDFKQLNNVYFIGIGGIGMSALARYFYSTGIPVYGYDRSETVLTKKLSDEGINLQYDDNIVEIPEIIKRADKTTTLIIYTPAIHKDNLILNYFIDNNYKLYKRAEVLGLITNNYKTVAVAGTHGKTSISTMAAHIFAGSDFECYGFLGGISKNTNSNLVLPTKNKNEKIAIVEADEFDRSFLHLHPHTALITSVDADHLDIYEDKNDLVKSFEQFVKNISPNGILICKKSINLQVRSDLSLFTYSLIDSADYYALNLNMNSNGTYNFDLQTPNGIISDLKTGMPGKINAENAIAALALAHVNGVSDEDLRIRLNSFKGVKRRFDFQIVKDDFVFIDDYAHHPEELKAFILSVKELYKDKKITGVFQPHLFTRTSDFADDFAKSLSLLDELILLDIYPARENPIKGVSSEIIFDKVSVEKKEICSKNDLLDCLKNNKPEILLTMGAGDIDKLVPVIKKEFLIN